MAQIILNGNTIKFKYEGSDKTEKESNIEFDTTNKKIKFDNSEITLANEYNYNNKKDGVLMDRVGDSGKLYFDDKILLKDDNIECYTCYSCFSCFSCDSCNSCVSLFKCNSCNECQTCVSCNSVNGCSSCNSGCHNCINTCYSYNDCKYCVSACQTCVSCHNYVADDGTYYNCSGCYYCDSTCFGCNACIDYVLNKAYEDEGCYWCHNHCHGYDTFNGSAVWKRDCSHKHGCFWGCKGCRDLQCKSNNERQVLPVAGVEGNISSVPATDETDEPEHIACVTLRDRGDGYYLKDDDKLRPNVSASCSNCDSCTTIVSNLTNNSQTVSCKTCDGCNSNCHSCNNCQTCDSCASGFDGCVLNLQYKTS